MGVGESKLERRASQSQDVSRVLMGVTEEPWSRTVTGVTAPVTCLPHLQQSWVLQPSLGQGWHRIHEPRCCLQLSLLGTSLLVPRSFSPCRPVSFLQAARWLLGGRYGHMSLLIFISMGPSEELGTEHTLIQKPHLLPNTFYVPGWFLRGSLAVPLL